ncbi:MAG: (Fe-S)-binding protein [Elusimicrobiaceae bacterium]|nr:(Fe-S)-binding protein [Elusimicrobiaceae bacterium]
MPNALKKQLTHLRTPLGVRNVYDSVCFCNRCGLCASVCPAYATDPKESNSPRARNQALRLLLERKINAKKQRNELENLVTSCMLCGRCEQVCPGQIPTSQHVLELRRELNLHILPHTLFTLLRWRETSPKLFYVLVRLGLLLRNTGLLHLLACCADFAWLKHTLEILPKHIPAPFRAENKTRPTLIYLPSLEAEFLLPNLAKSVYQLASKKYRICVWHNTACGLFEYVYGDVQRARKLVRALIIRHEKTAKGNLPLLTDSIDVYHFLKQAAQLFHGLPKWEKRATAFAKHILFVTDVLPKKPSGIKTWGKPVLLMPSALFSTQSPAEQALLEILRTLFKKNLVECGYKDACTAPAGYGFIKGSRAQVYNVQAVRTAAQYQTQSIVVLSGWAELETNFYIRRFYPAAQAHHIAKLNG